MRAFQAAMSFSDPRFSVVAMRTSFVGRAAAPGVRPAVNVDASLSEADLDGLPSAPPCPPA